MLDPEMRDAPGCAGPAPSCGPHGTEAGPRGESEQGPPPREQRHRDATSPRKGKGEIPQELPQGVPPSLTPWRSDLEGVLV